MAASSLGFKKHALELKEEVSTAESKESEVTLDNHTVSEKTESEESVKGKKDHKGKKRMIEDQDSEGTSKRKLHKHEQKEKVEAGQSPSRKFCFVSNWHLYRC
jgi:hypothetical protein